MEQRQEEVNCNVLKELTQSEGVQGRGRCQERCREVASEEEPQG